MPPDPVEVEGAPDRQSIRYETVELLAHYDGGRHVHYLKHEEGHECKLHIDMSRNLPEGQSIEGEASLSARYKGDHEVELRIRPPYRP